MCRSKKMSHQPDGKDLSKMSERRQKEISGREKEREGKKKDAGEKEMSDEGTMIRNRKKAIQSFTFPLA